MEKKYYEILRHYVNPNDCATVVKQLLSLHNVVGQSEQLCDCKKHSIKTSYGFEICAKCGNEFDD